MRLCEHSKFYSILIFVLNLKGEIKMILWISIAITIISFILLAVSCNKYGDFWDFMNCISLVFLIALSLVSVCLGAVSVVAKAGADAYLASMQEKRIALVYQLENDIYDNDNDLGKKELYSEITEYNCDIAEGKIKQDNILVYNLYPDVYDELEFIEFPEKIEED